MVLSGRQTVLRGREGRALDVENVGGEGGNRSTYTPGRSPGQGTGSGGRGGERGVAPDPGLLGVDRERKGVKTVQTGWRAKMSTEMSTEVELSDKLKV